MRYPSLMNRSSAARALTAGIAALLSAGVGRAADAPTAPSGLSVTALLCGHLIDTAAGKVLGETTIVIEGGRVKEVHGGLQAPAGATAIDLKTQTCMPGLIDSHTHITGQTSRTEYVDRYHWNLADYVIRSTVYARRTLLAGFTTIRNLGDSANESAALRNAINA
ncbi:MAG TPA: amidohydrolase family protein, partial [Steroidobacteraceae bacterium]|nr:amidohydrolase family protein [Steroidobacteraceae bacterium]